MAGGIDWFRWHHGSVTDPKFQLIARRSGASLPDVLSVWAFVLESASASADRGNIGDIDAEALDCLFNFPVTETRTADILKAMEDRGLIESGRIVAWDKRQPKREREGDSSTERSRKHREAKKAEKGNESNANDADATPCNAMQRQETPREEESREEKKDQELSPLPPKGEAGPQPEPQQAAAPVNAKAQKPDAMEGFAEFWMRYPKKKSKHDAEKAWAKLKPNAELRAVMLAALGEQVRSHDWTKNAGQYIPLPATWLNGKRWQDEGTPELLDNHHGFNGERNYTKTLEAKADGSYRF